MRDQALFPRLETGVNTDDIILTTFVNGSYRRIDDRSKCTDSGFDQASIKPKKIMEWQLILHPFKVNKKETEKLRG